MANDFQRYYDYPTIFWLSVGDWGDEMRSGPAREAGFYILPFCDPMCCRPAGPFVTAAVALAWARQEVEKYNPHAGRWRRGMNPWRTVKAWTWQRVFERRRWSKRTARYLDEEGKRRNHQPNRAWWPRKPQARSWARETPSEKKASLLIFAEAFNLPRIPWRGV
jgi:hypothetical protein